MMLEAVIQIGDNEIQLGKLDSTELTILEGFIESLDIFESEGVKLVLENIHLELGPYNDKLVMVFVLVPEKS